MKLTPIISFNVLIVAGLSLMFVSWLQVADTEGFLLFLFLVIMCVIRGRFSYLHRESIPDQRPGGSRLLYSTEFPLSKTLFIDLLVTVVVFLTLNTQVAESALIFLLFQFMFWGLYPVVLLVGFLPFVMESSTLLLAIAITLIGLALNFWKREYNSRLEQRDYFSRKNYQLESLQDELTSALNQVEQMSIVAERSRISSEIHDNAGHEIVASFITLQTVRKLMEKNPDKALELFDKSLDRLSTGVGKMRDAVHNMSPVRSMGVDRIREICENYSKVPVKVMTSGDMTGVTVNVWHVLEAVVNESLTNVTKHSKATYVKVELDVTKHLVRLLIENDGIVSATNPTGTGLRNLRYRVVTVGGNLTVDKGEVFKVVCVVPIM